MASCLRDLIQHHISLDEWHDGDVVMTNDPYSGGQHLPDVQTFAPVFVDGERVGIVGILVHHPDVGGGAPGRPFPQATEVFQEGIRIPPVRVVRRGEVNDDQKCSCETRGRPIASEATLTRSRGPARGCQYAGRYCKEFTPFG